MKTLLRALRSTFKEITLRRMKRNTNDPDIKINRVRSVMRGALQIVDGLVAILTLGMYLPDLSNTFIMKTLEERFK